MSTFTHKESSTDSIVVIPGGENKGRWDRVIRLYNESIYYTDLPPNDPGVSQELKWIKLPDLPEDEGD